MLSLLVGQKSRNKFDLTSSFSESLRCKALQSLKTVEKHFLNTISYEDHKESFNFVFPIHFRQKSSIMGRRHISLKDLASELNVSISTVSRALRNHSEIRPELTQKIQELARAKNYTPNPLAMGLLRQETRMIGVIVPDLVTHFFSSVISGIEFIAKQNGYYILISSSNESYDKEVE